MNSDFRTFPLATAAAAALVTFVSLAVPHLAMAQPAPVPPPPRPGAMAPAAPGVPAAPATPTVRVRGTVVFADARSIIVKDRGGEVVSLARAPNLPISEVYRIRLDDIKPGSYIGTAAMPQPDGTQRAREVLVFPEAARGTGEGHFPWDLEPQSTMTNATVADMAAAPSNVRGGQRMRLSYKGGEKVVVVPADVPVVTFRPGDETLLVPGARVLVNAQERNGVPTALRVMAGKNGFVPPM
jgi:multidrug efflux pump subunit AcrA (membrane-fusion protein)